MEHLVPCLCKGNVSIVTIILKFRPVLQLIKQCHWCTGKAYSPSHRFSSPETKLWPSDCESPPTTSQETEAGQEKVGEKKTKETEEERKKRQ